MITLLWIIVIYAVLIPVFYFSGDFLNKTVMKANDGQMPVVANRPTDFLHFNAFVYQSSKHTWSNKKTKLIFLSDWINTPVWRAPPRAIFHAGVFTGFHIWQPSKVSIGDIFVWIALLMTYMGIYLLPFVVFFLTMTLAIIFIPQP